MPNEMCHLHGYIHDLCSQLSTICPSPCSNHLLPVDGLFIRLLDIETHGPWAMMGHGRDWGSFKLRRVLDGIGYMEIE